LHQFHKGDYKLSNATAINYNYLSHQAEQQQDGPIDEATLSNHVEVLKDLAQALIREIDRLRHAQLPDVERGVNFYEEVERFEVNLIRSALERTGCHQTRAARLLGINVTTLNHKIKRYKIDLDEIQ
jgi:DNA-binding NtrC family response regulator